MKAADKRTQKSPKGAARFSDEELAAMKDRVKEMKSGGAEGESDVLEKIAAFHPKDRAMAERIHAILKANFPDLVPKTWYGMPAYSKNGNTICFFQSAQKFKTRYATLGFSDKANLDEGKMWPNAYALMELTPAEEAKIVALVKRAVS